MSNSFSIIIPNFNGENLLPACLDSIFINRYKNIEVIVVDNNSTDQSVKILEKYPKIRLVRNQTNLGFAKAVNAGAKIAKHKYLLVLNNDVVLSSNWLFQMDLAIQKHRNYFSYCGTVLKPDQTIENTGFIFYNFGKAKLRISQKVGRVWGAPATATIYRKKDFLSLGGFDHKFFAYIEDVDLSYRANQKNLPTYYTPTAICTHQGGATSGQNTPFRAWHTTLNWIQFILKNYSILYIIRFLPQIITERLRNISYLIRTLVK